ncbi:phosphoribosylglycinamide formyltransferase [Gracilimonas sp. BCB1]|uniref:phosphoribosylglycinamide formyltransferase n=1 Tax=Gracilimonas sp. BCB1 TaxID=3152362 RepID=UPI0032D9386C
MKTKIVFLGSGGGGNLKFIHRYYQDDETVELTGVFTDRECGALEYAQEVGIPSDILDFRRTPESDANLLKQIEQAEPDFVITNVHKVLSETVVQSFSGKLINLHYSYLPAYKGLIGMEPVHQALLRNNSFIGCTAHFADEKLDNGDTISQGIFNSRLQPDVVQATFECGAITLLSAIEILRRGDEPDDQFNYKTITVSPGAKNLQPNRCADIFKQLQS